MFKPSLKLSRLALTSLATEKGEDSDIPPGWSRALLGWRWWESEIAAGSSDVVLG